MEKIIEVEYLGGMKVGARIGEWLVKTDQSVKEGGEDSAPSPFDLFLASLATCSALYARRFCESRSISTEGLEMRVACGFAEKGFRLESLEFRMTLPDGFPDKYVDAIGRAVEQCTVKKHVMDPPQMSVVVENRS